MTKRLADLSPEEQERQREASRQYRDKNRDRRRIQEREYSRRKRASDPAFRQRKNAASNRARLKARYGVTEAQVQQALAKQKNKCAVCEKPLKKYHIDHCHTQHKFRAILCPGCNTFLGKIEKHPRRLWAAMRYLEEHK